MLKTPFFPCKVTSPRIVSIRQQYHLMWQEQKWSSQSLNLMFGIYIFVMVNFLKDVVCHSSDHFGRAIIMPNLKTPATKTSEAIAKHCQNLITSLL